MSTIAVPSFVTVIQQPSIDDYITVADVANFLRMNEGAAVPIDIRSQAVETVRGYLWWRHIFATELELFFDSEMYDFGTNGYLDVFGGAFIYYADNTSLDVTDRYEAENNGAANGEIYMVGENDFTPSDRRRKKIGFQVTLGWKPSDFPKSIKDAILQTCQRIYENDIVDRAFLSGLGIDRYMNVVAT